VGTCEIDSNYSCPNSCERNILSGCHNYTLNTTNPCTEDNLCNYFITLMNCRDEEICAPQNPLRNTTKHLTVSLQLCTNFQYVNSSGDFLGDASSDCSTPVDIDLTENTPRIISDGFYSGSVLVVFSPGIPDNSSGELVFPGNDGHERVCYARWNDGYEGKSASLPYCSYACSETSNYEYINFYPVICANGTESVCTREVRIIQLWEVRVPQNNTYGNSSSHGNSTDSHSDGYILTSQWKIFLMLIIVNLFRYC